MLVLVFPFGLYAEPPQVAVLSVRGAINPVTADYLERNLEQAAARGDRLVLVELDTPGGLDSAMRQAVQAIFASPVPVAVYVTPAGARAASAGAVIALAADICALAPGTNIGAAHPVSLGQQPDKVMGEKVLNDAEAYLEGIALKRGRNVELARKMVRESLSLSAEKAVAGKVADLVAEDRQALIAKLDGRHLVRGGKDSVLKLAGARLVSHPMGTRDRILNAISNPDLAYLLMLMGFFGIFFELANPGVILPGVVGGISLILAFFAFQTLPVNYAGALLILLAIILFIAEVKIVSHGVLAIGGCVAMVFGSLLLFPSKEPYLRLSWQVIAGTVLVTLLFFLVVVAKVIEAHRQKPLTGIEAMLGTVGTAETDIMPRGMVLLHGELWQATSREPIGRGEQVEVTAVEGLCLSVTRKKDGSKA
ncbi:MAG TPA: nodulation protein NfeD [Geomonas sp.]|nr:nodulation protein NfeD [Geomonas sp.]